MRPRLLAVLVALLGLALGAAPAEGAEPPNHPFVETFAPLLPPAGPPPLKDACGVAVDSGGRVFVSNYYQHAVYIFSAAHDYVAQFHVPEPLFEGIGEKAVDGPCDLALDGAGNLYVNNWHRDVVKFVPTSATTFAPGVVIDGDELNEVTGVAVDPASGNLLVDNRTYVAEYAAPVTAGSTPLRTIGLDSLEKGYGVAVSSFPGDSEAPGTSGWVYVADASDNTVKVFDPGFSLSAPWEVIDGDGTPQAGFNHLADTDLAVDPLDGHLYVVDNLQPGFEQPEAMVHEFSPRGHYRGPVPPGTSPVEDLIHAEPSSLAIHGGDVYVTSGNYFVDNTIHRNAEVKVFGPAAKVATHLLTASKLGAGSGVVFSVPAGLRCGGACVGEFPVGGMVTLAVAPAPHNRFVGWSGCADELSGNLCEVTMDADHFVTAEFAPIPQRTLSVTTSGPGALTSSPVGIDCGATCAGDFDEGSEVRLTAVPVPGGVVGGWSGCDSNPRPTVCRVTMGAARAVEAVFTGPPAPEPPRPAAPEQRILSVLSTGTGAATGTVMSAPGGIDCGGTCARAYLRGTGVTLTARPAPGSRFLGWGGCDSAAGDRCVVALGDDKTVVAAFGPGSPGPLRFGRATVHGDAATLRLTVPAPGTLSASGRNLRPASTLPLAAGRVSMTLRLNGAGRRALARARGAGLPVKVALELAPFDGGDAVRARKTVVFGGPGGGK
jgi:DNA-binding beta-propeller fold protein YncE